MMCNQKNLLENTIRQIKETLHCKSSTFSSTDKISKWCQTIGHGSTMSYNFNILFAYIHQNTISYSHDLLPHDNIMKERLVNNFKGKGLQP